MGKVEVSILMPVFNVEKYIKYAIESIQAQTLENWELIIVNDGSTDNSSKICDDIAKEDKRIKVIHKSNTGVSDTRNILLNNANGEYIVFVDSDDYIEKNMLEVLINKIELYNADLSVCGIIEDKIINDLIVSSKINKYYPKDFLEITEMKEYIMEYGNSNLLNSLCNKLYKNNIIRKSNIVFDTNIENGEDLLFNLEYMKHIKSLVFCEEQLYHYARRQNQSITNKYVDDMYYKGLNIHNVIEEFLNQMGFLTEKNKCILCRNHVKGIFSAFLNLFHKNCPMSFNEKILYINKIISRDYVKECVSKTINDKGVVGITAKLIRVKSSILIIISFKFISIIRGLKNMINIHRS